MSWEPRNPDTVLDSPDGRYALEERVQTDHLDVLHAMRDDIIAQIAPLQLMHGPANRYDDRRKQMLEACKVRARAKLVQENVAKITEGMVDALAYNDPQYVTLMDEGDRDGIEYIHLHHELFKLDGRIEARAAEVRAYCAEARLDR